MASDIRHPHIEEFDSFMRYVEQAFGHSKGFFERVYPRLYRPTEEAMSWAYVISDENGDIVSHVGLYPIESVVAGVHVSIGGIGAVSTAPRARGKGYMTELLTHVIEEMRRIGYPVSWLGGDRQRYNTFGWEMASPVYDLSFTDRSLAWHDVAPTDIVEVYPEEALPTIRRFMSVPACHAARPQLEYDVQRQDLRFFISEDGYAILDGQSRNQIRIAELVSASGDEKGWIRALLNWNFGQRATWTLSMWDQERLERLMPYASHWGGGHSDMYRVNDLTALLNQAQGFLTERAVAVRDFSVAIGVKEHDRTTVTTLSVADGEIEIQADRHADDYVEMDVVEATRLFLGGPPIADQARLPASLLALLPVPVYVFPLDHV